MKRALLLVAVSSFLTIASFAQSKKPTKHTKHTIDTTVLTKNICPHCHSNAHVIPISYGKPGKQLIDKAERGEVKLGGCMISENSLHFYCKKDKQEF